MSCNAKKGKHCHERKSIKIFLPQSFLGSVYDKPAGQKLARCTMIWLIQSKSNYFFFKTTYGRSQWWFEYNDLAVATDFQAQVDFVEATTITITKNASKIGKVAANKKVKADSKRRTRCSFTSCFGGGYTWLLNWGKARTTMRIAAASTTTTTATILVDLTKVQT